MNGETQVLKGTQTQFDDPTSKFCSCLRRHCLCSLSSRFSSALLFCRHRLLRLCRCCRCQRHVCGCRLWCMCRLWCGVCCRLWCGVCYRVFCCYGVLGFFVAGCGLSCCMVCGVVVCCGVVWCCVVLWCVVWFYFIR